MAHSGGSLAIAVNSGLATIEAFMHLPEKRRPHLHLEGVDEVLKLYANSEKGANGFNGLSGSR